MKFIFRLEDNDNAGNGCDHAFIDITLPVATELIGRMDHLEDIGASEIRFRDPPIVFFKEEDLREAMSESEFPVEEIFEHIVRDGANWCRVDPKFEFPAAIKAEEPSMSWVEVVVAEYGVRWEAAERKVNCTYVTKPLNAKHLRETRDKLVKETKKKNTKLIYVELSTFAPAFWSGFIRVPAGMTQEEANAMVRNRSTSHVEMTPAGSETQEADYTLLPSGRLVEGDIR